VGPGWFTAAQGWSLGSTRQQAQRETLLNPGPPHIHINTPVQRALAAWVPRRLPQPQPLHPLAGHPALCLDHVLMGVGGTEGVVGEGIVFVWYDAATGDREQQSEQRLCS